MWDMRGIPLAQGNFVSLTAPSPIYPGPVPTQHGKNKPFLFLLVFDASMEARNALKRTEVNVHLGLVR